MTKIQVTLLCLTIILLLTFVDCGIINVSNVKSPSAESLNTSAGYLSISWATKENVLRPRSPMEPGQSSGGGRRGGRRPRGRGRGGNRVRGRVVPVEYMTDDANRLDGAVELFESLEHQHPQNPLFPGIANAQLGALGHYDNSRQNPWLLPGGRHYRAYGRTHLWQFNNLLYHRQAAQQGFQYPLTLQQTIPVLLRDFGRIGSFELSYGVIDFVFRLRFVPWQNRLHEWPQRRRANLQSFILVLGLARRRTATFIPPETITSRNPQRSGQREYYDSTALREAGRNAEWGGYGYQGELYIPDDEHNIRRVNPITVPASAIFQIGEVGEEHNLPPDGEYRIYWALLVVEYPLLPVHQLPDLNLPLPEVQEPGESSSSEPRTPRPRFRRRPG